jgi:hypothetical protein
MAINDLVVVPSLFPLFLLKPDVVVDVESPKENFRKAV